MSHTPGDWRWEIREHNAGWTARVLVSDASDTPILAIASSACSRRPTAEDEAVIAAAPDLLRTLKRMIAAVEGLRAGEKVDYGCFMGVVRAIADADDALSRIEP